MNHGQGIKDLDDKSSGMEILMADAFAKINPTDPLILAKQAARRKRNWPDSSGMSLARAESKPRNRFVFFFLLMGIVFWRKKQEFEPAENLGRLILEGKRSWRDIVYGGVCMLHSVHRSVVVYHQHFECWSWEFSVIAISSKGDGLERSRQRSYGPPCGKTHVLL